MCSKERLDFLVRDNGIVAPCECGGSMELIKLETGHRTAHVHGDDIPGGILIKHGICNPDATPRRYYSKSEMAKTAKAMGLTNYVVHETDPKSGSDKSRHTQRFVGAPSALTPAEEAARIAAWHADEEQLKKEGVPTIMDMPEATVQSGIAFVPEVSTSRSEIKHIIMKELGKA